jgi:hypothetical protein
MFEKSWLKAAVVGGLGALGVVAMTAPTASAYVACNHYGECWHSRSHWAYPRGAGIVWHSDRWRFSGRGYRWAGDRAGRGYWRHGAWVTF